MFHVESFNNLDEIPKEIRLVNGQQKMAGLCAKADH